MQLTILLSTISLFLIPTTTANLPPGVSGPRWPTIFEAPDFHLNIAKRDIENALNPNPNLKKNEASGPRWPTIFEDPGFHLNIAKRDIENALNPNPNLKKYEASGPRWPTIFEAPDFHLNIAARDVEGAARDVLGKGAGE